MVKWKDRTAPIFIENDDFISQPRKRLRLRFALVFVVTLGGTWAWHDVQADPYKEIRSGQLLATSTETGSPRVFANIDNKTTIEVSGMVAHVSVEQHFRNDHDSVLEGIYVFPLPDKAAVHRMRIRIGERIIRGIVKEKAQAKALYQQAKSKGNKAALVSQHRPNLFKTNVANIPPGETIVVELDYIDLVQYQQGQFELRFPMAITPRYSPRVQQRDDRQADDPQTVEALVADQLGWSQVYAPTTSVTQANLAVNRSPAALEVSTELTVSLDTGLPLKNIESAYHNININNQNDVYWVNLDHKIKPLQKDFVLRWQAQTGKSPKAALFKQSVKDEDYVQMMLLPPQEAMTEHYLPREMIYVIDTSGSMQGQSIIQAKKSLALALDQLTEQDHFNVLNFNTSTQQLFDSSLPATSENIINAKNYINRLQAGGGTEMMTALKKSLRHSSHEERVRQVIFITDGAVSNEEELFKAIYQHLGNSRLFTVGIGSAPNTYFMRKAAEFGRGSFTHIGDVNVVHERMARLFSKLNKPLIRDITIEWPAGSDAEQYPKKIPDLYEGEPLLVNASVKEFSGLIKLRGKWQGNKSWEKTLSMGSDVNHLGIGTLWARQKIQHLLDQKVKGRPEQEVRQSVLDVALTHQLMSPYTSFIAIDQKPNPKENPALGAKPLLNAVAMPKTATRATLSLLWGGGLMLFFIILKISMNKEEDYDLDK